MDTKPSARLALASLVLCVLISSLGTSIANVGLPAMAEAFGASFRRIQWILLAYLLTMTALAVAAGRVADIMGRRAILLVGIALFTGASIACAVAPSLPFLVAARAAQGAGAAAMMVLAVAFVREAVPKGGTGTAMGMLGTTSAVGTALGPSIGGLLIGMAGWRALFGILVPLGLLAFALAARELPRDASRTTMRARWSKSPGVPFDVGSPPAVRSAMAMSALVTSVVMATLVVGPFYLSTVLALDSAPLGLVMACGPIVAAFAGIPAGRLVDRYGTAAMTMMGLVGMAAGSIGLAIASRRFGIPGYVAPLALVTAGYGLFQAANNTSMMIEQDRARRGVVSGWLTLSRNVGLIIGASLMGAIFALGSGSAEITTAGADAVASGMRLTFLVSTGLILLALGVHARGGANGAITPASHASR